MLCILRGLSFWEKLRLAGHLLVSGVSMPKGKALNSLLDEMQQQTDLVTAAIQEMGESFPWLVEALIDERDRYMAARLKNVSNRDMRCT